MYGLADAISNEDIVAGANASNSGHADIANDAGALRLEKPWNKFHLINDTPDHRLRPFSPRISSPPENVAPKPACKDNKPSDDSFSFGDSEKDQA